MNIHSAYGPMPSDEAKLEAILKAALKLFNERGFHGTPVPLIAEAANVGAGTIYRSFPSKEKLVNELYRRWKRAVVTRILDDFPHERPPRDQFRAIWESMAEFAMTHPHEVSFLEFHAHRSYLEPESVAIEQDLMRFGILVVKKAQDARAVKALEPRLLIELINGAFLGVFRAAYEGRLEMSKEVFMQAEQCCWEAIRA